MLWNCVYADRDTHKRCEKKAEEAVAERRQATGHAEGLNDAHPPVDARIYQFHADFILDQDLCMCHARLVEEVIKFLLCLYFFDQKLSLSPLPFPSLPSQLLPANPIQAPCPLRISAQAFTICFPIFGVGGWRVNGRKCRQERKSEQ